MKNTTLGSTGGGGRGGAVHRGSRGLPRTEEEEGKDAVKNFGASDLAQTRPGKAFKEGQNGQKGSKNKTAVFGWGT